MPRTARRLAALLLAAATLASLAACAPGEPEPTPSPTAAQTDAPIFASDEEALAAAIAAYEEYTALSTELSADSSLDAGQLRGIATESHATETIQSLEQLRASGTRAEGSVALRGFTLADVSYDASQVQVQMYACNDLSQYRILDGTGMDITPADRAKAVTFLVSLVGSGSQLLVDATEPWTGSSVC